MHRPYLEYPRHTNRQAKLAGVAHRLQGIMFNENISGDELVECAQVVRDNHDRFRVVGASGKTFEPAKGPRIPPMTADKVYMVKKPRRFGKAIFAELFARVMSDENISADEAERRFNKAFIEFFYERTEPKRTPPGPE